MILIRETDNATDIRVPRREPGGRHAVVVEAYTDGVRLDTQLVYTFEEWGDVYAGFLKAGFRPEPSAPDVRVHIDTAAPSVTIAGGQPIALVEPGTGDEDDPAEQLVDQADAELFRAGYLRLTDWWTGGRGMHAVANESTPTNVPLAVLAFARTALTPAVAALRSALDPGDPEQVADWLLLCEDPIGDDFPRPVLEMQRRRLAVPALALYSALLAARAGHVSAMIDAAAEVQLRLAGVR